MAKRRDPRKAPKQERSRALIDAILDATEELAQEKGIKGVTVPAVVKRSGVAAGSIYEWFPGKEALLAAWVERVWERALAAAFQALAHSIVEEKVPVAQGIHNLVRALNGVLRPYARACRGALEDGVFGRGARRDEIIDAVVRMSEGAMVGGGAIAGVRVRNTRLAAQLVTATLSSDRYMEFLAAVEDEDACDLEVSDMLRRYLGGD